LIRKQGDLGDLFLVDTTNKLFGINGATDSSNRIMHHEDLTGGIETGYYMDVNTAIQPALGVLKTGMRVDHEVSYTGSDDYFYTAMDFALSDRRTINSSTALGVDFIAGIRGVAAKHSSCSIQSAGGAFGIQHMLGAYLSVNDSATYTINNNLTAWSRGFATELNQLGTGVPPTFRFVMNASGQTLDYNVVGFYHEKWLRPTLTAGTLNLNHYGSYVGLSASLAGYSTSNGYAYYADTTNSSNNWSFYAQAGDYFANNGVNFVLGTTTGTKFGTSNLQKMGFFNATPIVQPTVTGAKGGNVALTNLLTALANLGLLVDSTT